MSEQHWTLGKLLDWTTKYLTDKGSEFPRLDAEVLLSHAVGCQRIQLYTRYEEDAPEQVRTSFREAIRKRVEGCPVAYLVGKKEFYSMEFQVSPAVLIPRPETEILVIECLRLAKALPSPCILDVGTGSGAIAVAVAKNLPKAKVCALDISKEALEVALGNAKKHGVSDRVQFLQSDLLAALPADAAFDFILSNPPYIPTDAIPMLSPGVRNFEPRLALDGGPGGYKVITRLLDQARSHLAPGGTMLIEIGVAQEQPVREIIGKYGDFFTTPATIHDYAGHARVLRTQRKE
jgi:release factor glutamine methyltransferase